MTAGRLIHALEKVPLKSAKKHRRFLSYFRQKPQRPQQFSFELDVDELSSDRYTMIRTAARYGSLEVVK